MMRLRGGATLLALVVEDLRHGTSPVGRVGSRHPMCRASEDMRSRSNVKISGFLACHALARVTNVVMLQDQVSI